MLKTSKQVVPNTQTTNCTKSKYKKGHQIPNYKRFFLRNLLLVIIMKFLSFISKHKTSVMRLLYFNFKLLDAIELCDLSIVGNHFEGSVRADYDITTHEGIVTYQILLTFCVKQKKAYHCEFISLSLNSKLDFLFLTAL